MGNLFYQRVAHLFFSDDRYKKIPSWLEPKRDLLFGYNYFLNAASFRPVSSSPWPLD